MRVQPDGSAIVFVGSSPHGQGHETTFAQIASDELGIPFERITVVHGDTETVLQGIGTMGSRGVPTAGSGVKVASQRVLGKAKRIAAHLLEAAEEDLEVESNAFRVRLAGQDRQLGRRRVGQLPAPAPATGAARRSLEERLFQESPNFSYPSGVYGCVVAVDRRTGRTSIERMVLVDDCGTVINPLLAEGQVHGGVAQGIAQALFEEVVYDPETGQPMTTNLVDYLVPSAPDLPEYVAGRITTLCPNNPLGAKGIGESGAVGAPAAVVNAVVDALAGFGVEHLDMPLLPEKVWQAMQGATGVRDERRVGGLDHAGVADGQRAPRPSRRRGPDPARAPAARPPAAHRHARRLRHSNCGACTVLVDGVAVKSCTVLAVQADGRAVTTIEGVAGPYEGRSAVQEGFRQCHGLQCGYCTPEW